MSTPTNIISLRYDNFFDLVHGPEFDLPPTGNSLACFRTTAVTRVIVRDAIDSPR